LIDWFLFIKTKKKLLSPILIYWMFVIIFHHLNVICIFPLSPLLYSFNMTSLREYYLNESHRNQKIGIKWWSDKLFTFIIDSKKNMLNPPDDRVPNNDLFARLRIMKGNSIICIDLISKKIFFLFRFFWIKIVTSNMWSNTTWFKWSF
jgi:hypothetical protein